MGVARRLGFSGAVALFVAATAPGATQAATRDGSWLVNRLRSNEIVVESGLVVRGPVDLRRAEVVRRVFRCRGCTFGGPLIAPDVTFARTVDLSGSTFAAVDFRGSTFEAAALFGPAVVGSEAAEPRKPRFKGRVDFSLATFEGPAAFRDGSFDRRADFEDARFAEVTFSRTRFSKRATFARASFRGATLFYRTHFSSPASFEESDFRSRVDFSRALFQRGGLFGRAQFGAGGLFLGTRFLAPPGSGKAATFQGVASAGDLNFTFATFKPHERSSSVYTATFSELVSARAVRLREVEFAGPIAMNELQVRDLVMDVDDVAHVADPANQKLVLKAIEESAKERGDLATANDAEYAYRVLRQDDYSPVGRALDDVFYRGVAGYFVRPLRPLLVLALLATIAAALRAFRTTETGPSSGSRARSAWRKSRRLGGAFVTSLLNTFSLVGPRRSGDDRDPYPVGLRLEIFVYRVLLVCALLGLANSNPTLREMVDTLF